MDRTEGIGNCSITVHLKQTKQASGRGVLFEACRVGSVNESDGSITLNWNMGQLPRFRPSVLAEQMTKQLSGLLFQGQEKDVCGTQTIDGKALERHEAVTSEDGTCTFAGLKEGAWLIHASASNPYGRIDDTLLALPSYVQHKHDWVGPVRNVDVWPKGEILTVNLSDEPGPVQVAWSETETATMRKTEEVTSENTEVPSEKTDVTSEKTKMPKKKREEKKTGKETDMPEKEATPKDRTMRRRTTQQYTSQRTQPVRTLDDTPFSGLICAFLVSMLVIGLIAARHAKYRKRFRGHPLVAVAFAGMLLALGTGSVSMAGESDMDSLQTIIDGERKLVFINHAPDAPCLSVTKEVLDAAGGSRAPEDDLFAFCLTLNGKRAAGIRYRVFDSSSQEWVDPSGSGGKNLVPASDSQGDTVPLRTGRDGSFFLRGGQSALFEEVTVGDLWEVAEQSDAHYERVIPASSAVLSGTVGRNGSLARYVNRYLPEENPDPAQGSLEITKRILWPDGIALPLRGSFPIRVTVDGSPLQEVQVVLTGLEEGDPVRYGTTDENGVFEIQGNERACIEGIASGSDARVEEVGPQDGFFRPSGSVTWKGAVSSRTRITLTNRLADFVVKKSLRSGDRSHGFTFCLLGEDGKPAKQVPYYLAEEGGTLVSEEAQLTDGQGHFSLHAGQQAVFLGMEEGSRFSVREEKTLGYRQVVPEGDGYSRLVVQDGIRELLFENEKTSSGLFAPSAGGSGIGLLIAFAAAGMITTLLVHVTLMQKRGKR